MMNERQLTQLTVIGALVALLVGLLAGGIYLGMAALSLYTGVAIYAYARLRRLIHLRLLDHYAKQADNIYECSEHPQDKQVYRRAQRHRDLLQESGNLLEVQVIEIYWEPWESEEEWTKRREEEIKADMRKRRAWLRQRGETFYKHAAHRQEDIPYTPPTYGAAIKHITNEE
jgi:hypothetical protein